MLLGINLEWNLCSANNNKAFLRVTPRFGSVPNFAFSLASSCPLLEQVKINNCPVISENTNSNWKEFKHFNKPINGLLTSTFTNDFSELLKKKKINSCIPLFRWSLKKLSRSFLHTPLVLSPAFRSPLPSSLFPPAAILLSSLFPVSEFSIASIS